MSRIKLFITVCFLFVCIFPVPSHANDIELVIKEVTRISEEEVAIKYSVISNKDFDLPNVSIGFKIIIDDKPVGCLKIKTTIPNGSDGSDIKEAKIKISGEDKALKLESKIFYMMKQYRIDEWFSDCKSF
jgi:hypothetical protein